MGSLREEISYALNGESIAKYLYKTIQSIAAGMLGLIIALMLCIAGREWIHPLHSIHQESCGINNIYDWFPILPLWLITIHWLRSHTVSARHPGTLVDLQFYLSKNRYSAANLVDNSKKQDTATCLRGWMTATRPLSAAISAMVACQYRSWTAIVISAWYSPGRNPVGRGQKGQKHLWLDIITYGFS